MSIVAASLHRVGHAPAAAGVIAWFLFAATGTAAPSLEQYAALPETDLVTLSPSGRLVAMRYTTTEADQVIVYDLLKGELLRGVDVSGVDPRRLQFTNDDYLLIVAGATISGYRLRTPMDRSSAFKFDLATGEIRQLLRNAPQIYPYQSGLGVVVGASTDGNVVYMPAFEKPKKLATPRYSLFRVPLDAFRERIAAEGSAHTIDWFVGGDGKPLVREDYNESERKHQLWAFDGSKRRLIYERETAFRRINPVGLLPDRSALIVTQYGDDDQSAFYAISLNNGEMTGPLLEREDAGVNRVIVDVNRIVHGVEYDGFRPGYAFFDPELNEKIAEIQSKLSDTAVRLASYSDDFSDIVVDVSGGWNSGASLLYSDGVDRAQVIASERPSIARDDVIPVHEMTYAAGDGLSIPALLTAQQDVLDAGVAALVVLPHGGPESYDRNEFDWLAQFFASRGYLVLQPQFRGSDGFGWAFRRAGFGEWGGKMQTDIDDGVRYLIAQGQADANRVCIVGASYGGYAALAASAFDNSLYRCAVSINGVADPFLMLEDDRRDYGRGSRRARYWQRRIGADRIDKDRVAEISPLQHAAAVNIPVLLIHGKDDSVVRVAHSRRMHEALEKAGKDVTYVELDGEDHWLSYPETRLRTLQAVSEFLREHLMTPAE